MKKKYPIGTQTFSTVIEDKCRYIDKTGYVYRLSHEYRLVFLSRPRRFGKSLLTSTLHSYFEGRKELFCGLELGEIETEWVKYPVLHFSILVIFCAATKKVHPKWTHLFVQYYKWSFLVLHLLLGVVNYVLAVSLHTVIVFFRADHNLVKLTQTGTGRDKVSADNVLLHTLKRINLATYGCLVEHLSGLLE